jgi:tetratricopeptide (TPR) repeat protein
MKQKSIKSLVVGLSLITAIGLIPGNLKAQKVTKLFEKEQYEKAEQYCAKQKGEKQNDCYKELADAYFENADYKKAGEYYEKVGNKEGLKKIADVYFTDGDYEKAIDYYNNAGELEKETYTKVADASFENTDYKKAGEYYEKVDNKEGLKKIADVYFADGDYEKAIDYYNNSGELEKETYTKVADAYFENADYKKAGEYYEKVGNKDASAASWIKYSEASIYSEIDSYRYNKDEQKYKENISKIIIEVGDANFIVAINLIINNLMDEVLNLMEMELEGKSVYGIESTSEKIQIAKWTRTAFQ